jgi:hypothetical protein
MLLAFSMTGKDILLLALAAIAGVAIVALGFKKDTEREKRRKNSVDLAVELSALGLPHTGEFFKCYGVGDYSGMVKEGHTIVQILKTPGMREAVLFDVVVRHLKDIRDEPDKVKRITDALGIIVTAKPETAATTKS